MKTNANLIKTLIPALLVCLSALPAHSADRKTDVKSNKATMDAVSQRFMSYDKDKDGFLSLAEFKAQGLDELAFKAADINGDGRIDPAEFVAYVKAEKADGPKPERASAPSPSPSKPDLPERY